MGKPNEKIDKILKAYVKKFGKDAITFANNIDFKGEVIPTGSLLLDQAIGIGGLPIGKVVEIYGDESSGKTTLSAAIVAQAQKMGKACAFIDAERTLDPDWISRIGVDTSQLLYVEPDHIEDAFNKLTELVESGADFVVFDSIAAVPALVETTDGAGDRNVGEKARIINQHLRKVIPLLRRNNATVLYINQTRTNIGVMYGNPETTPGGKALRYASSIRLRTSKKPLKQKQEVIGDTIKVKVIKNKLGGRPYRTVEITLLYDKGFDIKHEIVQLGVELGFIERAGAWYTPHYLKDILPKDSEPEKVQGMDSLMDYLYSNEKYITKLEELVRANLQNIEIAIEDEDDSSTENSEDNGDGDF